MSQSFSNSAQNLGAAVKSTEAVQKAAREFLVSQSAWAKSFNGWASEVFGSRLFAG